MPNKNLYRSCKNRVLGGVAGGLGEYFEIDPSLVRLVFVLFMLAGFGIIAYILAWLIIPLDPSCDSKKTGADEIKDHAERVASDVKGAVKPDDMEKFTQNSRFWIGVVVLIFGLLFLFQTLIGINFWINFWPIVLVAVGVIIIAKSMERK